MESLRPWTEGGWKGREGRRGWKREKEEDGSHGGNRELQTFTVMRRRFEWGFLLAATGGWKKTTPSTSFFQIFAFAFYRFTITRWQQLPETLLYPRGQTRFILPRFVVEREIGKLFCDAYAILWRNFYSGYFQGIQLLWIKSTVVCTFLHSFNARYMLILAVLNFPSRNLTPGLCASGSYTNAKDISFMFDELFNDVHCIIHIRGTNENCHAM